jgi:hypothetical protein
MINVMCSQEGATMAMAAKAQKQIVLPDIWPENASDEDRKEINKIVEKFLDTFETSYRQKIEKRNEKK